MRRLGCGDRGTASQSDRRGGACHRTTYWSHGRTVSPSLPVRVGRHDTHALLDSGSVVTLVQPGLADGTPGPHIEVGMGYVSVWRCIHRQTETYPKCHITVQTAKGTFTSRAGIVPNLRMPLLIGRDCTIFERLLVEELRPPRPRQTQGGPCRRRDCNAYMAAPAPPSRTDTDGYDIPESPGIGGAPPSHALTSESLPSGIGRVGGMV